MPDKYALVKPVKGERYDVLFAADVDKWQKKAQVCPVLKVYNMPKRWY